MGRNKKPDRREIQLAKVADRLDWLEAQGNYRNEAYLALIDQYNKWSEKLGKKERREPITKPKAYNPADDEFDPNTDKIIAVNWQSDTVTVKKAGLIRAFARCRIPDDEIVGFFLRTNDPPPRA